MSVFKSLSIEAQTANIICRGEEFPMVATLRETLGTIKPGKKTRDRLPLQGSSDFKSGTQFSFTAITPRATVPHKVAQLGSPVQAMNESSCLEGGSEMHINTPETFLWWHPAWLPIRASPSSCSLLLRHHHHHHLLLLLLLLLSTRASARLPRPFRNHTPLGGGTGRGRWAGWQSVSRRGGFLSWGTEPWVHACACVSE